MQDIVVKRIDEGLGLVLEVPSEPTVSPGFVHISNIADSKIDKLQQVRQCGDLHLSVLKYRLLCTYLACELDIISVIAIISIISVITIISIITSYTLCMSCLGCW